MTAKKWVFLIGNGLGRSIDDEFFLLSAGIRRACAKLSDEDKRLINLVLKKPPEEENDLIGLHYLKKTIEYIPDLGALRLENDIDCTGLPKLINRFRREVAGQFFCKKSPHPPEFEKFAGELGNFIVQNGEKPRPSWSNICLATTNYDNLLYSHYLHNNEFGSQKDLNVIGGGENKGMLQDGFDGKGFSIEQFFGRSPSRRSHMGYYLHLHGSVLYESESQDNGTIKKKSVTEVDNCDASKIAEGHIVLANSEEKLDLIHGSKLLKAYWEKFECCVLNCDYMVILGCGAQDRHIADLIRKRQNLEHRKKMTLVIGIRKSDKDSEKEGWKSALEGLNYKEKDLSSPRQQPPNASEFMVYFSTDENTLAFDFSKLTKLS